MHPTLLQQLGKAFKLSSPDAVEALLARWRARGAVNQAKQANQADLDDLANLAEGLRAFFAMVDDSYRQFERAQDLRLRSLTDSATELGQANARLREDSERQRNTIDSIRAVANRMLSAARQEAIAPGAPGEQSAERLIAVLSELIADSEHSREQLARSEARFRALTGLSSDWYWETDAGGRYVYLSEGVVTLIGLAPEDCLGKTPWEALGIPPETAPWPAYRDCVLERKPFREIEAQFDVYGQDTVYFLLSGEPRHGLSGEFRGYHGVARDITPGKISERRRLEALKLTESLIELAPTALSIKDAQLRLLRVNAAFVDLFEIDRERWMGRTARELRGDAAARSEDEERRVIELRTTVQFETTRALRGGRERHYIVTKAPMLSSSGEVTGIISTYVDVTQQKQAQRDLARELRLSEALIESMPMPVSIKDREHRILRINAAYETLFDVRREDVIHGTAAAILKDAARGGEAEDEQLLKSPGVMSYTRRRATADGADRYFVLTKATTHAEGGEVTGFITTHTDVTELTLAEQKAADELRLANSLLEVSPTPTVVKDVNLITTRCNSAYERLFEVRREDMLGKTMDAYRAGYSSQVHAEEMELLRHPGVRRDDRTLTTPSGKVLFCIVTKSTVLSAAGKVDGLITTITDITELKQTEQNLIEAKQTAENAMRARAQFLANMSHEIRTPMNGMLGMASVLEGTPLNDEQMIYVNAIRDSGESLLKIVGDILDFSKIDAGKLQIEETPFHVRSRVTSVVQLFSAAARGKNLALNANVAEDIPSAVLGDPVRVMQALSNLVANAIKFTEQGSVTLSACVAARSGDDLMLRFEVRDTGIGISRDAIERIFDPFAQEDASTTRRYGGTGLGLSISRQLAGLMGGELAVQSVQGQGSTFSLTVKVRESHGVYPPEAVSKAVEPTLNSYPDVPVTLNVLLAEDNHVNQIVARAMLNKLGCTVTVAKDGNEVLALTGEHRFDVILMDCHMPNLDGYGATAVLRERERSGHMGLRRSVIIAQTANTMEGDRESCLAAGMDDYIPKPITIDVLAETLRRWKPKRSRGSQG